MEVTITKGTIGNKEYTANWVVTVPTGIEIKNNPTKNGGYREGDELGTEGLEVVIKYDNGEEEKITDYTIRYQNGESFIEGDTKVTIEYTKGGETYSADIILANEVSNAPLNIEINKYQIREEEDVKYLDGIPTNSTIQTVINAITTNGAIEVYNGETLITDYSDTIKPGYTIRIYKDNESEDYTIGNTVDEEQEEEVKLSEIKVTTKPSKTEYTEGEKFDPKGIKIEAVYSDGTTKEITNYTYSPNGALKVTDTKITITYKEGEVTKTYEITITVKAKEEEKEEPKQEEPTQENETDDTTTKMELPNTGMVYIILPIGFIMVIAGTSVIIYVKKYKNI